MNAATRIALGILAGLLAAFACADEPPRARIETRLAPTNVAVGQATHLIVDIWVTTWFLSAPELAALQADGTLITLSDESQHLQETRDGTRWFGIERNYQVTPVRAGAIAIPAFSVQVRPGPAGTIRTLSSRPLILTATAIAQPAAAASSSAEKTAANVNVAAGQSLVSTAVTLSQQLDRDPGTLKVGDSFTRTITITAAGTPAMLLPPIAFAPIAGLAIYPAPPVVENRTQERVGFVAGRRVDAATYVVQRAGTYTLPALDIAWWNPQTRTLRHSDLPAVTITATGATPRTGEFAIPAEQARQRPVFSHWQRYALIGALLALTLLIGFWLWPLLMRCRAAIAQKIALKKFRYASSERSAYRALQRAFAQRQPASIYAALCIWIARLPAPVYAGPAAFAAEQDEPRLAPLVERLQRVLFTHADTWDAATNSALRDSIARMRRGLIKASSAGISALQPLNPR